MICSQNDIKMYKDFQLTNFNTLKINSTAREFYMPDNYGELITLVKKLKKNDKTPIILGCGSNVLFSSKGVNSPVIYTGKMTSVFNMVHFIEVEAGYRVQALSKYALEKKLTGFEFLIGIPASLGGAIYMNAGAHNQTISDNLISAKVYDCENNKVLTLRKEQLGFSYRHSILQEKPYILLSARFKLKKAKKADIKAKMDEFIIFRKNRQPNLAEPNAGSVFKNPPKDICELSAGALIDQCGLRGFRVGDCQVWQNHCNFIVNLGSATSIDYTNIVFEIYSKVKEKFGVELTPEIIYIGKMTKDEEEKWKVMRK